MMANEVSRAHKKLEAGKDEMSTRGASIDEIKYDNTM